jgi:hypothetical protein
MEIVPRQTAIAVEMEYASDGLVASMLIPRGD